MRKYGFRIKIFLKAHPNVVNKKEKGMNFPSDKRFLKIFNKSIGFKNVITNSILKRSNLYKNLFQIHPNVDNLQLLKELKMIKSLKVKRKLSTIRLRCDFV